MMKCYVARPGICIDVVATDMVQLAIQSSEEVVVVFNGVRLLAKPPTQAKEIIDSYWEASGINQPSSCNLIPFKEDSGKIRRKKTTKTIYRMEEKP